MAYRVRRSVIPQRSRRPVQVLARKFLVAALTVMGTLAFMDPASARVERLAQPQRQVSATATRPTRQTPDTALRAHTSPGTLMRKASPRATPKRTGAAASNAEGVSNAVPLSQKTGTLATVARPAQAPQTLQAYVTGYSYFDNTPPGSPAISHPVIHRTAAGLGTFSDPITVAVGHSIINGHDILDWPAGSKFYLPNLRRYFIVEDTCGDGGAPQNGPCHIGYPAPATTWLDVWVDGRGWTEGGAHACMDAITGVWTVLRNPSPKYAVVIGSIIGVGGCSPQYGNSPTFGGLRT